MVGHLNLETEEETKQAEKSLHLKLTAKKMLDGFQMLKKKQMQSENPDNDAELFFIDRMIGEFETDLQTAKTKGQVSHKTR
jgi:hypothetical protein